MKTTTKKSDRLKIEPPRPEGDAPFRIKRMRKGRDIFTSGQVAKICGVAARTAAKWIDAGLLKGQRLPGCLDRRVYREDLVAFLDARGLRYDRVALCGGLTAILAGVRIDSGPQPWLRSQEVGSVVEAALLVGAEMPDVVVMDFSCGRRDCLDLAGRLSKQDRRPHLIAVLPDDGSVTEFEAKACGFAEALVRPMHPNLILDRLAELYSHKMEG